MLATHCSCKHIDFAVNAEAHSRVIPALPTRHFTLHRLGANHRHSLLRTQAIGFELPGSTPTISVERQAENLIKSANSLLLYQSCLKSKAGSAFRNILLNLPRGDPTEHYADLYRNLALDGYASWQDYLLDQIFRSTDNAFVQNASKGERVSQFTAAVAYDLDVLQQLAVADATLAGWVKANAGLSEEWLAAASTLDAVNKLPLGGFAINGNINGDDAEEYNGGPVCLEEVMPHVQAPLSKKQRLQVSETVAKCWKWSEAVPLLETYHQNYDRGVVSMHHTLKWTGTALQAQDVLLGVNTLSHAAEPEAGNATLTDGLKDFTAQPIFPVNRRAPLNHTMALVDNNSTSTGSSISGGVDGQPLQSAYRRVLSHLAPLKTHGVRTVILPTNKVSSLPELAWTLSQHPRVRFVVVLPWTSGNDYISLQELGLVLSGDGFSWPVNALFVGVFPKQLPVLPAGFSSVVEL